MNARQKIVIEEGGIWEFKAWEIEIGYELGTCDDRCRHCRDEGGVVVCPRVVVGANEGGFSGTGICLDCIVEAASAIAIQDRILSHGVKMSDVSPPQEKAE